MKAADGVSGVKLDYQGFHPSAFTENYLGSVLGRMIDEAPKKAFLHGHFSRHGGVFKGIVKILSHGGEFFASAEGDRLKDVLKRITAQLRHKMSRKKQKRVDHSRVTDYGPQIESNSVEITYD